MAMKGPELPIGYGENGSLGNLLALRDWMPEDYSPSDDPQEVVADSRRTSKFTFTGNIRLSL